MDCDRVTREEIAEIYLIGRLSDEDRDAFEQHYFECARCFDELRTLQAIQQALPRMNDVAEATPEPPSLHWASIAGLAAAIILAVGLTVWMRPVLRSDPPVTANTEPSAGPELPATPQRPTPEPTVTSAPSLEQLARVEPPPYQPLTLRGTQDEPTARFMAGMARYQQSDYRGAVDHLRDAAELDPDAAHIRFFLGIAHLMSGQENAAVDRLRATIALGDSPYLEEAHFYLAKAFLRQNNLAAAEAELHSLIRLHGTGIGEARRLLTEIQRLKER